MDIPANDGDTGATSGACPSWCVTGHGVEGGEEDWLHLGEPLALAEGLSARLCMSLGPEADTRDGPYIVIGTTEHTLQTAEALGAALIALAETGAIRPEESRMRSPGP